MNKYFSALISILVLIIAFMAIYFHLQTQRSKEENKQIVSKINFVNNILKEDQIAVIKNENYKLDSSLHLTDLKNETIRIDSLSLKEKYIVLFFSSEHCNECVNYSLVQIKQLITEREISRLLIITSKYNLRDLYVFAHSNQFDDSIFYSIESLKIPIEKINQPFIFLLDSNLIASHFFIPRKEIPEQMDRYLSIIKAIGK